MKQKECNLNRIRCRNPKRTTEVRYHGTNTDCDVLILIYFALKEANNVRFAQLESKALYMTIRDIIFSAFATDLDAS
jgi:hypothetical protein